MSIELPKDAEGREIPLDTEVLYDECGTKVSVKEFLSRMSVENRRTEWTIKAAYEGNFYYNSSSRRTCTSHGPTLGRGCLRT